jgi:hypothetical protein
MSESTLEQVSVTDDNGRVLTGWNRLPPRIAAKISPEPMTGCWLWTGAMCGSDTAYGQTSIDRKKILAHRVVYEVFKGAIPAHFHIDHLCRQRSCVNPDHLEPVTSRENTYRGTNFMADMFDQTHCKRGHELSGDNLYLWHGHRHCRACNTERKRRTRASVRG